MATLSPPLQINLIIYSSIDYGEVHHIEYCVNDLKRSNEFWSWFLAELAIKNPMNGLNHIAFMGKSREQVIALKKALLDREIKITFENDSHICFEDPNDFAVEVYIPDEKK